MTTASINGNVYSDDSTVGTRNLDNGGHRTWFLPLITDVVAQGAIIQANATTANSSATIALQALGFINTLMGGGTLGIGTKPGEIVRAHDLGTMAFLNEEAVMGFFFNTQNTTYQILLQDKNKVLLTTSGTNTWTLPLCSDVPMGFKFGIKNRSGNNLTLNRSGSDTINAAATSLTIATGTTTWVGKSSATTWESI
jgi:hypothetical protein